MRVFFLSTNQNMAESLRRTLGRSNIDVVHARSFQQARRLLSSPPDIFFADYYIHSEQSVPFIQDLQKEFLLEGSDIWHVLEAAGLPVKHALLKDQLNFVKLTSPVEGAGKELFLFSHQKKKSLKQFSCCEK